MEGRVKNGKDAVTDIYATVQRYLGSMSLENVQI